MNSLEESMPKWGPEGARLSLPQVRRVPGLPGSQKGHASRLGYTLPELLLAIATLGMVAAIALPSYHNYLDQAKVVKATADIRTLDNEIRNYELFGGKLPQSLSDIGRQDLPDPYGNPYQYLNIADAGKGKGDFRKDRFLVPLNSDYDLYSKGKDGQSQPALTAQASLDDIVRANDGAYVGLASEY